MYSKNGDKRVPPGIILPENYSGNAFIKQDGTPSEQPRGNGGSGAQSAEDRGCATSGCGDRQMCETDTARKAGPERADDGDAGCGCRERPCGDGHGMPAVPECGCSDRAPEAKPGIYEYKHRHRGAASARRYGARFLQRRTQGQRAAYLSFADTAHLMRLPIYRRALRVKRKYHSYRQPKTRVRMLRRQTSPRYSGSHFST